MSVLLLSALVAPAHASLEDQPKKLKKKQETEQIAEVGRDGAKAKRPEGATPPQHEQAPSPLARSYTHTSTTWVRSDYGQPWTDPHGGELDKDRIRAHKREVERLMEARSGLLAGTTRVWTPAPRDLTVPRELEELAPSVWAYLGPDLKLVPGRAGMRRIPGGEQGIVSWSVSAAHVDFQGEVPRAAALDDRKVVSERSTVTMDGDVYVEFDRAGQPTTVARVATDDGSEGCGEWQETQLWTLSWSGGVLQRVDGQEHYVCADKSAEMGWGLFETSTVRAGR